RVGNFVYAVSSPFTATITAGTGIAYFYISAAGVPTVGHTMTVSCSGSCAAVTGITGFPADSIPLLTWSATGGVWDTNGNQDRRAFLSTTNLVSGTGLTAQYVGGQLTVGVDPAIVGLRAPVPASSTTAC